MKKKIAFEDIFLLILSVLIIYGLLKRFVPDFFDSISQGLTVTVLIGRNLIVIGLFSYLVVNIITDIFKKKIYNMLTIGALIFGLITNLFFNGPKTFLFCVFGAIVGFLIFLLPFLADTKVGAYVKVLTVIGAFMGVKFILWTALFILIINEIVVIVFNSRQKGIKNAVLDFKQIKEESTILRRDEIIKGDEFYKMPFGLTILLSVLAVFYFIGR